MERDEWRNLDESEEDSSEEDTLYEEESRGDEEYFEGWVSPLKATVCELRDTSPLGDYPLTIMIIALNIIVFIFTFFKMPDLRFLYRYYPNQVCIAIGECLPGILLSMFSHADIFHIIGNMFFLYIFGDNVEITLGKTRYLILYFASGFMAALTHSLIMIGLAPSRAHLPIIGASGAISGVVGSYLVLYPGASICKCIGRFSYKCFKVKSVYYIAFWILLQFIYALIVPYIAVWAHLGGFFTGLALTTLLASRSRIRELHEEIARGSYRGVSPSSEDIENPSLGVMTRAFVVLVAILFITLVGVAYVKSSNYIDRYYTIYLAWRIEKVECIYVGGVYVNVDPNEILGRPPPIECFEFGDFLGSHSAITTFRPSNEYLLSIGIGNKVEVVATYILSRIVITAPIILTSTIVIVSLVVYTMIKAWREIEVI
jgi:membrane associated rhomboid family serine protease